MAKSVSYTHLDVYKRQVQHPLNAADPTFVTIQIDSQDTRVGFSTLTFYSIFILFIVSQIFITLSSTVVEEVLLY